MNNRQIALLIPVEYRREILATNMIGSAMSISANASMNYLAVVWKNYVSPNETITCGACLERILNNWRMIQMDLIELEKQSQYLDSV